jgi:hypothetical protein
MNRRQIQGLQDIGLKAEKYHIPMHPCWGLAITNIDDGSDVFVVEQFSDVKGRQFFLGETRTTPEQRASSTDRYRTQREAIAGGLLKYTIGG